jgi:hypothetical protein
MAKRPKSAFMARLAVGVAVLAFPLIVAGVAQASIAGATPSTTVGRPDIRSATISSATSVEVCYDKTLETTSSTNDDFFLVGYRSDNTSDDSTSAAVDPTNTNCLIVNWAAAGIGDPTQYTALEADGGAVKANGTNLPNLADSVTLTGSLTHAGTTGVTTAPDLVGIDTPTGSDIVNNKLTYVFDKTVGATINTDDFFYVDGAGNICYGNGSSDTSDIGSTTVTVTFSTTCSGENPGAVTDAVRGGVLQGAVDSASDSSSLSVNQSVVLPSAPNGGATERPDLVSAALNSSNHDEITFTFDKDVVVDEGSDFVAELSDGTSLDSTNAVGTGGTTVTATFSGDLSDESEYGVIGWAYEGAVEAADNVSISGENTPGSAPIGGNAGAFASGFTTGPDVFGVAINASTGVVTVDLDQRIDDVDTGDIELLDNTGAVVAATPTPAFNSSAPPGPEVLTLQYSPSQLINVTQVDFDDFCAMETPLDSSVDIDDECSIPQIDGATASGSILRSDHAKKDHARKAKKVKKAKKAKKAASAASAM